MSKVLVVEADKTLCKAIRAILEMDGHEVLCAHDGGKAIEMARATAPSFILCDTTLPRQDGFDVLDTLRQDRAFEAVPFVLMAAYLSNDDLQRGLRLGANGFLIKPFTVAELLRKLDTTISSN